MKKIIILLLFFTVAKNFAQTNGITYQAVIMNARGSQLPSVAAPNIPLVEKNVCMVFKFIDEFSKIEYQESIQTKTDQFGMVNLIIGSGIQTAGYADSFKSIVWSSLSKNLVVGINTDGNCSSYTEISNQPFSYVPLAFSALNAENVTGVVAIENGGTNAITVLGAKTNFEIQNVDNTRDVDKPLSAIAQSALNLKENLINKSLNILTDGTSDTKYPTVKSVKSYVDASATSGSTSLGTEVSRAMAAETANATAISTEVTRATNSESTIAANLVTETNSRSIADAALTTNLATEATNRANADLLKEDLVNKSTDVTIDGASDTKYPTVKSVKSYVDASATSGSTALGTEVSRAMAAETANANAIIAETTRATNSENTIATNLVTETNSRTTADATLSSNLVTEASNARAAESANAAAIATETTDRTTVDLLKEDLVNKSTDISTDGASDTKYPTVKSVKSYVDASATSGSTALGTEVSRATAAERANADAITAETTNRTNADATLSSNLVLEASTARAAESANATAIATETTDRTTADLLKEDLVNKSTDISTDGSSDTKYPTVKSVKTYVDASATSGSTALGTEVSRAMAAETANTTEISTEVTRATNSENTIAANLVTETNSRTTADTNLSSNLVTEASTARAAESANATAIAAETSNRTAADALKEDLVNKSTDISTDGLSDTKYPTVKSVKSYVDASSTSGSTALGTEVSRATASETANATAISSEVTRATSSENTIAANLVTEINSRTAADTNLASDLALEESTARAAESANATAIATETAGRTTADLLKEDLVNKSTDVTIDGTSDIKYPTVKSVKSYVDASATSGSTALGSEVSRATAAETANADAIAAETTSRTAADATLASNLVTEASTARAAESANATAIATETTNRTAADATLTSNLASEASTARASEAANATAITTETSNRISADGTLAASLATEVTNRNSADALKEDLANKSTDVTTDATSDTKYPTVKSVKTYVDASSTSSSTALTAEISRATGAEATNASTIATETTNRTAADATLTSNLALEASTARAAESANATAIITETTNRTSADLLKEDLVNKSTDVTTDGASDTKYPTVKSVKAYVDASSTSSSTALTAEISRATASEATNASAIATETTNRTAADATLTSNLVSEASTARAAETANATAITTETSNRAAADLLKEDLVNKSTDVSTDGTSDTKYPTVKSVKSYVDASSTSSSTALSTEISRATSAEATNASAISTEITNRTSADATLTTNLALETSTARAAESANATAIATETTNRTAADATLTSNLATEITNRTNADLLKEDLVNKSTDVTTDGASDTKYPTVKSVKIYVDASSTSGSTALIAEVSRATGAEATIASAIATETTNRTAADATLTSNLASEASTARMAEAANATAITTETSNRTAADATLTSNLASEASTARAAETANATAITTETSNRAAADLLKEGLANKSTDVTTDGTSDTKYPTVKSVKTYVDANSATSSTALNTEISRATAAEIANADAIATETTNRTTADATLTTNLASEASTARAAESANATAIITETTNRTTADLLKEDLVNKSTDVSTDGTSDTKYPTVKSVKTYVDASSTTNSTALTAEISRATGAETTLVTNLATEATTARAAELTNATAIASETSNRNAADLLKANIASPTFTGAPSLPIGAIGVTQDPGDDSVALATTAFVTAINANTVSTVSALKAEVFNASASDLVVGDFVGGGVVFWVDPADSTKGLACAVTDQSTGLAWSNGSLVVTGATATAIGTGAANTDAIIAAQGATATNYAAGLARAYVGGGYEDWFLPSMEELLLMWSKRVAINPIAEANGGVALSPGPKEYWSSSEAYNTHAKFLSYGQMQQNWKNGAKYVRAVRAVRSPSPLSFATIEAQQTAQSNAINLKANIASPTFTGTVSGITKAMVGLTNVDNTTDVNKPVSTATQTAIDLKVDIVTGKGLSAEDYSTTEKTKLAAITGSNTGDQDLSSFATNTNLALKANIASPTFTGTVSGITQAMVGLTNVDNTTDANKPVSAATQTAIDLKVDKVTGKGLSAEDYSTTEKTKLAAITGTNTGDQDLSSFATNTNLALKANIASPTFTGTVSGITKAMVGLTNVDNTTDANKPVSIATQTAIDLKANLASPTLTGTPLAPTAAVGTNSTQIATTEFVKAAEITEVADEFAATASQISFTLTKTPATKSKVKMYVNGIRISNTAYSVTGSTLTYGPSNNGGYTLSVNDRIQFDYFY